MIADYAVSLAENGWHDRWSAARQAQREYFDRNCERPRSRPRPPRRPRLESDSVTVRLQSSSRTRGDSYLNNHFSDSQLDFQIGFILWPPTAFLSYLYSPHSPLPNRILIFPLFSLLHALIVCLTCGRERRLSARLDSIRLDSSRLGFGLRPLCSSLAHVIVMRRGMSMIMGIEIGMSFGCGAWRSLAGVV